MKNMFEILTENGVTVAEDLRDKINKAFADNYKTAAEFEKRTGELTARISELEKQNGDYAEQIKGLTGDSEELNTLRQRVSDYEAQEAQRRESMAAEAKLAELKSRFAPLSGDKKYLNEGTENWIFSEFQKALEDQSNKGKSDADIYAAVIKDKNIFENPQQKTVIPAARGTGAASGDKAVMDRLYADNPFYKK